MNIEYSQPKNYDTLLIKIARLKILADAPWFLGWLILMELMRNPCPKDGQEAEDRKNLPNLSCVSPAKMENVQKIVWLNQLTFRLGIGAPSMDRPGDTEEGLLGQSCPLATTTQSTRSPRLAPRKARLFLPN